MKEIKMNKVQAEILKNKIDTLIRGKKLAIEDKSEFSSISEKIKDFTRSGDKNFILDVSQKFFDNWGRTIFDTYFTNISRNVQRSEAKEMARLYMNLFDQEFPETFLENYHSYRSI